MSLEFLLILGFLFHLIGDYIFQNDWLANNKTKQFLPAFIHATIYSLPFLFVCDFKFWLIVYITHYFIDRYRLAVYWIRLVNCIKCQKFKIQFGNTWLPINYIYYTSDNLAIKLINNLGEGNYEATLQTEGTVYKNIVFPTNENFGYWKDKPTWMSIWLMIIVDNTWHLIINSVSITLSYYL